MRASRSAPGSAITVVRRRPRGERPPCGAGVYPAASRAECGARGPTQWPCPPARTWPAAHLLNGTVKTVSVALGRGQGPSSLRHSAGHGFSWRLGRVAPEGCAACGQRDAQTPGARGLRGPCFGPSDRMRAHAGVLVGPKIRVRCPVGGEHAWRMLRAQATRVLTDFGY